MGTYSEVGSVDSVIQKLRNSLAAKNDSGECEVFFTASDALLVAPASELIEGMFPSKSDINWNALYRKIFGAKEEAVSLTTLEVQALIGQLELFDIITAD